MGRIRTLTTNTQKYTASEMVNKKKNLIGKIKDSDYLKTHY